jgi:hypothetical protein
MTDRPGTRDVIVVHVHVRRLLLKEHARSERATVTRARRLTDVAAGSIDGERVAGRYTWVRTA